MLKISASGATRSDNVSCRRGQRRLGCDVRATAHRVGGPSSRVSVDRGNREAWLVLNAPDLVREKRLALLGVGRGKWSDGRRGIGCGKLGGTIALAFNIEIV